LPGERRLANVWVPERTAKLGPQHLFPILEKTYPEPARHSPSPAEQYFPNTLRRLQQGQPLRLLAWGDSVTGGYLGRDQWQHQLVRRLQERFPQAKIELISVAWGGGNSRNFLTAPAGHPLNYAERVLAAKPDVVISEFLNDSPLDAAESEIRYRQIREDLRRIGAEWIILTPHPSTFTNPREEREVDDDPRPYVKMLRRFAPEQEVALADAAARYGRLWRQGLPWTSLMGNSANHPDERGMAIFVDSVLALFP
jgi:lysophospholipase L1-like esterase